ncbi:MAG: PaaX family transcriptional regulator C-terminal domain-containing protein [Veillonellales bacterium]
MSSFGYSQYSFDDLKYLTSPFEVTETSLRTSLSRMIRESIVQSMKEGKTAFYCLSQKGKTISSNVSLSFKELDWDQWDREWWGFLFSVPDLQNQHRHKIRKKIVAYRFANYYPGFWIRPLNSDEKIGEHLQPLINTGNCALIKFRFEKEITKEEVAKLWKLNNINEALGTTIRDVEEHLSVAEKYKPEQGLLYKFLVGNDIVNALFNDPLLPDEFLPDNWKGKQLRRLFITFDKTMTRIAKPYIDKHFQNE